MPDLDAPITCLNPCFSGTYCDNAYDLIDCAAGGCLNPCFSGTYCDQGEKKIENGGSIYCLNPCFSGTYCDRKRSLTKTTTQLS